MVKKLLFAVTAVTAVLASQAAFAQTKTLDFYSSSGSNRYSIAGKVKDLNLIVDKNSVLITEANSEAYVKLNGTAPYHLRFIESDLSVYQIIEFNKGKTIQVNGKDVKLIGAQGDKVIADDGKNLIFISFDDIKIPKTFLIDAQKGLKASFSKEIKPEDVIYFSQPERQLSYRNSYESVIDGNKLNLVHYLNINNASLNTFKDVYLNFFLSENNIQENLHLPMMKASRAVAMNAMEADSIMPAPVFENAEVQNLKTISIKEPMTIYPNFNKIKYLDKSYPIEQYADLELDKKYQIYLGNKLNSKDVDVAGSFVNKVYIARLNELKDRVKKHGENFKNIIEVKVDKGDVLPNGKLDIYEGVKGQDKLIVSTNISHNENKPLKVIKSKNNDLKIINIELEQLKNDKNSKESDKVLEVLQNDREVWVKLKSIEVENMGKDEYTLNVLGKKTKIKPGAKLKIAS